MQPLSEAVFRHEHAGPPFMLVLYRNSVIAQDQQLVPEKKAEEPEYAQPAQPLVDCVLHCPNLPLSKREISDHLIINLQA